MTNAQKALIWLYRRSLQRFRGKRIGKIYPIRAIYNRMASQLKADFAEVQGHKMYLDSEDSLRLSVEGVYEPIETALVKRLIQKGDVVIDIGANIGYYTLIFARLVGQTGKVFAFEPEPSNRALLKKNVEMNGYKNVELIQKAISDKTGRAKLYLCEHNKGMHRIYRSPFCCSRHIEIDAVALDDYFKDDWGKISFIKIDIEGAEYGALRGMAALLQQQKAVKILTEFAPASIKAAGAEPDAFLNLLAQHGFKLYDTRRSKAGDVPVDAAQLLRLYVSEKNNKTNLLCVR